MVPQTESTVLIPQENSSWRYFIVRETIYHCLLVHEGYVPMSNFRMDTPRVRSAKRKALLILNASGALRGCNIYQASYG